MLRRMPTLSYVLMIALLLTMAGGLGCGKKIEDVPEPPPAEEKVVEPEVVVEKEPEPEPEPVKIEPAPPKPPTAQMLNEMGVLQTVYFDFDSSALSDQTRAQLRANADWLKANTGHSVVLGGHCDERGTKEYNMALGERRASAVRDYLASLGVDTTGLRVISYGEEDPADTGHNEDAWAKNRRCMFVFE
jgi:peptidoglycan-associated lipoprotein